MSEDKIYKPKDVALIFGVTVRTLERWNTNGILKANKYPSGRLYYYYQDFEKYLVKNSVQHI